MRDRTLSRLTRTLLRAWAVLVVVLLLLSTWTVISNGWPWWVRSPAPLLVALIGLVLYRWQVSRHLSTGRGASSWNHGDVWPPPGDYAWPSPGGYGSAGGQPQGFGGTGLGSSEASQAWLRDHEGQFETTASGLEVPRRFAISDTQDESAQAAIVHEHGLDSAGASNEQRWFLQHWTRHKELYGFVSTVAGIAATAVSGVAAIFKVA